jgi:hypothetical protein
VLGICSSLITITTPDQKSQSKVVSLAHHSVKEYLTSERVLQSRAARYGLQDTACNEFIARSCISYLLQFQTLGSVSESIQDLNLAIYAAKFWISHAQVVAGKSEALNYLIIEFLSTGNGAYLNWVQISDSDQRWNGKEFEKVSGRGSNSTVLCIIEWHDGDCGSVAP